MTAKPNLLSLRAINLFILFPILPTFIFIVLLVMTNIPVVIFGTIISILISFRFSIYYLFEKVTVTETDITFSKLFSLPNKYGFKNINNIDILFFYSRFGYTYVFLLNKNINEKKSISLKKDFSFKLHLAWYDNDIAKITKNIPNKYQISINKVSNHNYLLYGNTLKRLFN